MVTAAPPRLPRLSASFMDVARQLGTPFQTRTASGCVVRTYRTEMGAVNVLFDQGRSVAMRVAGRMPAPHPNELAPLGGPEPEMVEDGAGWSATEQRCP